MFLQLHLTNLVSSEKEIERVFITRSEKGFSFSWKNEDVMWVQFPIHLITPIPFHIITPLIPKESFECIFYCKYFCCVFWTMNGCFACLWLVKIIFFGMWTSFFLYDIYSFCMQRFFLQDKEQSSWIIFLDFIWKCLILNLILFRLHIKQS